VDRFDKEVLESESGVRALWLLYKRGQWGRLEDFGIKRGEVEALLDAFDRENAITHRLTKAQCRRLSELIPDLEGASTELRLAYALSYYEREEPKMKIYKGLVVAMGEGNSDDRALELAEQYAPDVLDLGGMLNVLLSSEDDPTAIVLEMPDSTLDEDVVGLVGDTHFIRGVL
jgi:hypothetical protein